MSIRADANGQFLLSRVLVQRRYGLRATSVRKNLIGKFIFSRRWCLIIDPGMAELQTLPGLASEQWLIQKRLLRSPKFDSKKYLLFPQFSEKSSHHSTHTALTTKLCPIPLLYPVFGVITNSHCYELDSIGSSIPNTTGHRIASFIPNTIA
jgi:hypothetical protein